MLVHQQAHQRSPHAAELLVALSTGKDRLVGCKNGFLRKLRHSRSLGAILACGPVFKQSQHLVDRQGAGNLAGCGAAHAVADQVNPVLYGKPERIFV